MNDMPEQIFAWYFIPSKRNEVMQGGWDTTEDRKTVKYIRADLTKPTVKPLEWVDRPGGYRCTTNSQYSINLWGPKQVWMDAYTTTSRHETLAEAKAAAQADYERRILSALEDTWTP